MSSQDTAGPALPSRKPYSSPSLARCSPLQAVTATLVISPLQKVAPSDARLKTAIEPLSGDALSTVMALRPVTFSWIDTGERQVGFVAQDVEAVLPDAIARPNGTDIRHIDLAALVSVLTKAVQELQGEVAELREENRRMRDLPGGNEPKH
jgi:hypothetical protein